MHPPQLVATVALLAAACSSTTTDAGNSPSPTGNDGSAAPGVGGSPAGMAGSASSTGGSAGVGGSGPSGAGGSTSSSDASASPADAGSAIRIDGGGQIVPLVPASGALLGMYFGAGTLAATETTLGRKVAIHLTYYAWNDDWTRGNTASDLAAGRIPLVNWEPHTPSLDDIIAGTYDTMLHTRAASSKALGKPFFLDWGAEMNGSWSPWSGANYGNTATKYVAAYKHIHDIFTADGATNVVWAWCPNVEDDPHQAWNQTMNYYPGDAYVDWTCVDGYNWGTTNGNGWQSFVDVFDGIYPLLAAKGKPILIGEMASTELGGNKAQWIGGIVPALKSSFPMIRAFVWFDVNKETDWRIASTTMSRDAFIAMGKDPYLNP